MFAKPCFRAVLGAVAVISVTGCSVGPDFKSPAMAAPSGLLTSSADNVPSELTTQSVDADWWKLFNDPVLTSLERRAAQQSLDLQAAEARIGQSRAKLKIAGADQYPTIGANGSYLRERASQNGILKLTGTSSAVSTDAANGAGAFGTSSLSGSSGSAPFNLWQYGFDASWELDLWGRVRRTRESAAANAQAAAFDAEAVRVSVSAELARTYLQLRGVQSTLVIAEKNQEIARASLKLAQHREQEGIATRYDAASAGAQLATVSATIPELERQRSALMNALALLLDESPHALDKELEADTGTPVPPGSVPVGLPSELAQRRPDIQSAEAELHAATAAIGVAKANFYPSISLTGSFGFQALKFSEAGDWSARQFALGPVLHLPIFEGGRLAGTLALTRSRQQEAAIKYRRTVLGAWHEVDDAVTGYRTEQQRDEQLTQAVDDNRIAFKTAQQRYAQGASTFLSVLIAQRDLLASETALTQSRTDVSIAMVKLYKSLGGGWNPPPEAGIHPGTAPAQAAQAPEFTAIAASD
jgi:NodT family efflux transporter outer membrane factor (OMF) lipoprotein